MKKFKEFYFKNYVFDEKTLKASFFYSFDNIEVFEEVIDFKNDNLKIEGDLSSEHLNMFLFNLHLALGISYYKLYPTEKLIVESGYVDDFQIDFWKKFYLNGLGEFFITNNINPKGLLKFINKVNKYNTIVLQNDDKTNKSNTFLSKDKSLLLIGGGKDSIVSYSLVKNLNYDVFVFGKLDKIKENTCKIIGKNPLLVNRTLSQNLFDLNKKGYFNGHVPISGIIAFITLMFSYIYDYKYIILSNEKSASEENILWNSIKINHQYSKSYEFEKDLSEYVNKYLSNNIKYFSILRGMYEYKISEIFSAQKDFFNYFSSCNKNFKILGKDKNLQGNRLWCCNCEKCAFVFLILSNFLSIEELINIFGENLFLNKSLEETYRKLIGLGKNKPFECVGTYEESLFSLYKAIKKYDTKNYYILEKFRDDVYKLEKELDFDKIENKLLKIYDDDIIPLEFKKLLKKV